LVIGKTIQKNKTHGEGIETRSKQETPLGCNRAVEVRVKPTWVKRTCGRSQ